MKSFFLFFFISMQCAQQSPPAYYIVIDQSLVQRFTSSPEITQKVVIPDVPFDARSSAQTILSEPFITKRIIAAFLLGCFAGQCVVKLINNRTLVWMRALGLMKTWYGLLKKGCMAYIAL